MIRGLEGLLACVCSSYQHLVVWIGCEMRSYVILGLAGFAWIAYSQMCELQKCMGWSY